MGTRKRTYGVATESQVVVAINTTEDSQGSRQADVLPPVGPNLPGSRKVLLEFTSHAVRSSFEGGYNLLKKFAPEELSCCFDEEVELQLWTRFPPTLGTRTSSRRMQVRCKILLAGCAQVAPDAPVRARALDNCHQGTLYSANAILLQPSTQGP